MEQLTPLRESLTPVLNERDERLKFKLGSVWFEKLKEEFDKEYMQHLSKGIAEARNVKRIYPATEDIFRAFKLCPFDKTKVIILGQDPYHDGNATGLAFEYPVRDEKRKMSPSLDKMLEIYNIDYPSNFNVNFMDGILEDWAKQGVLLLNVALTVPHGEPGKHLAHWKPFTAKAIEALIFDPQPKVFVLLGAFAQEYASWVVAPHIALCYEHPAYAARQNRKWDAEGIFRKINAFLIDNQRHPIEW